MSIRNRCMAFLPCLFILSILPARAQIPTLDYEVDVSDPAAINLVPMRGETISWRFLYYLTNGAFSIQSSTNAVLLYRDAAMVASNTFHQLSGTVTGNAATFTWSPGSQPTSTNLF